jgi:hypothetical protein
MTDDELLAALAIADRRRQEHVALLAEATAAGVPWSRELDRPITPQYRTWLAHEYVCRRIGVDPLNPPPILGAPPARPGCATRERLDRDLDALTDYSLQPLHEFGARRSLASAA